MNIVYFKGKDSPGKKVSLLIGFCKILVFWGEQTCSSVEYLKETRNSYFCVTPQNCWLMFVS